MSDISNISEDEESKVEDCALVDALSEMNLGENTIELIRNGDFRSEIDKKELQSSGASSSSLNNFVEEEYDYYHDSDWINKKCQVFILSTAGKPIYTLHGDEDKLNTLFGLLQALVSVIQASDDCIKSITAKNTKFVFLVRNPLILVAVNKCKRSEAQILNQLM
jgi:hypothetical protein